MSASKKKQLRKEQNAAALTDKQQKALKEAKKLKHYTTTFVVAMVLIVAIIVGVLVYTPINSAIRKNTDAVQIGDYKLTTPDLTYYYIDAISDVYNQYYEQFGSYASMYLQFMGLDVTSAFDKQFTKDEDGNEISWAKFFMDTAIKNAKSAYAIYDLAVKDSDFKLDDTNQALLDSFEKDIKETAKSNQYSSVDAFLRASYGAGADMESYFNYYKVNTIANAYYADYADSLEYTNEQYREHEKGKFNTYNSYTYSYYYIRVDKYLTFLKLGTTDPENKDKIIYSDEDQATALAAAKADADALMEGKFTNQKAFEEAVKKLAINVKDSTVSLASTSYEDLRLSSFSNGDIKKWMGNVNRKPGDMTVINKIEYTDDDKDGNKTEEIHGFYVVLCEDISENLMKLENVRHILVQFQNGSYNSSTGETTYSDAEQLKAKNEADRIFAEWQAGAKTEESFSELAKKESDDGSASEGGLIDDIYPGWAVSEFDKWCFDENRQKGDVEIIETEYGFHIMYYIGESDITYRDYLIKNELIEIDAKKWYDAEIEKVTVTTLDLSNMDWDYRMG